ncbi:hypothetical protein Q8F55_000425 [Vanrija albida]|uniref:Zn(2)-C6 fungal-type domain-containing protein n=1 Tax=Vanrija albida TaxID=181172 RepID=A0ABR3QDA2_9TREE
MSKRDSSAMTDASTPSGDESAGGRGDGPKKENTSNGTGDRKRDADEGIGRVQLACFYCRAKRIRCSGEKPVCSACSKTSAKCEWPAGRRRKRTRREMEEARRQEEAAQTAISLGGLGSIAPSRLSLATSGSSSGVSSTIPSVSAIPLPSPSLGRDTIDPWAITSSAASFTWPANFLPDVVAPDVFSFDVLGAPAPNVLSAAVQSGTGLNASTSAPTKLDPTLAGFLDDNSPGTDLRLLQALENQQAYVSGDPNAGDDLELWYYRFSGSTAIHPGINRISLKLQKKGSGHTPTAASEEVAASPQTSMGPPPAPVDLWDANGLPHRHVWDPIFDKFTENVACHFPSVSRRRMTIRYDSGTQSAFLANCILAVGARFTKTESPVAAAAPFVAKAQELVAPLLHLPAYDVVTGLLLLAWACYGQGSESGLWQYSGMAIRMAIDLGMHENSEIFESPAHLVRIRLLFWNLFVTDRVVAFATGRPASIPEDMIEIPLPENADFFPDRARDDKPLDEPVQPVPYVYLVRLMVLCGRISNVLNGRRGHARTLVASDEPLAERLAELQARLVSFYAALPDAMKWSADNFKHQHSRGNGGTFLSLHLWANAVLALVYHPDLLKSPSGVETPLGRSMPRNVRLAIASSRQICECMVFADLVGHTSYIASPVVVQPLYVAAMALIHEMRAAQASEAEGNASELFLVSMTRQNFTALLKAILSIETAWAGASYVASLLQKRSGISLRNAAASKRTFISLPDQGMLQRFISDPNHPHDIAPATETSMRNSAARQSIKGEGEGDAADGSGSLWLSDLLSGYSVGVYNETPADSFDFARLMALGGGVGGDIGGVLGTDPVSPVAE